MVFLGKISNLENGIIFKEQKIEHFCFFDALKSLDFAVFWSHQKNGGH